MLSEYRELLEWNENDSVAETEVVKQLGEEWEETKRIENWLIGEGLLKRGT